MSTGYEFYLAAEIIADQTRQLTACVSVTSFLYHAAQGRKAMIDAHRKRGRK